MISILCRNRISIAGRLGLRLKWGDKKEPELAKGFAAGDKGRAEAACRIDRSSGYRDCHEMDQHQGDADG